MLRTSIAGALAIAVFVLAAPHAQAGFHVCGGPDNNETVNSIDALLVLQDTAGLSPLQGNAVGVADVDNDGDVDSVDATLILQFGAGLVKDLHCFE